jgi:hypothetical protein
VFVAKLGNEVALWIRTQLPTLSSGCDEIIGEHGDKALTVENVSVPVYIQDSAALGLPDNGRAPYRDRPELNGRGGVGTSRSEEYGSEARQHRFHRPRA